MATRRTPPPPQPLPESQHGTSESYRKFLAAIEPDLKECIGFNGYGKSQPYVRRSTLKQHWTSSEIRDVLVSFDPQISTSIINIQSAYLQTFSALFYSGFVHHLALFTNDGLGDTKLPLTKYPPDWEPDWVPHVEAYKAIKDTQWMFFPLDLNSNDRLDNRKLNDNLRVPITELSNGVLNDNSRFRRARVVKVRVEDSLNHIVDWQTSGRRRRPVTDTFVLKTYPHAAIKQYEQEHRVLTLIEDNRNLCKNIIEFYGSFRHGNKCHLLLEYCDGGNLMQYLDNTPPPTLLDDIKLFWKSLFSCFIGIGFLHGCFATKNNSFPVRGIHQDLRPDNIVLSWGPSGSKYDFVPKIIDFELSEVLREPVDGDSLWLDNHGSQRNGAPEAMRSVGFESAKFNITPEADIYSIGGIFSVVLIWLALGQDGVDRYFKSRLQAAEGLSGLSGTGYEGGFHDGDGTLEEVEEMHRAACRACKSYDYVSPFVSKLVLEQMLCDASDRCDARRLHQKFLNFIDTFIPPGVTNGNDPSDDDPAATTQVQDHPKAVPKSHPHHQKSLSDTQIANGTAQLPRPDPHVVQARPRIQTDLPQPNAGDNPRSDLPLISPSIRSIPVTIKDIQEHTKSTKASRLPPRFLPRFSSSSLSPKKAEPCRVEKLILALKKMLIGRDQFFFIDDSHSMLQHKADVIDTFNAMAFVAREIDKNDLELAFTSEPNTIYSDANPEVLSKKIEASNFDTLSACMMHRQLNTLVDTIIKRLPKSSKPSKRPIWRKTRDISIYILTAGAWHGGDFKDVREDNCLVDGCIKRLVDEMKKRELHHTQVMLQFICFGTNRYGDRYMEYLDDDLSAELEYDIVDRRLHTASVLHMFVGSISRDLDREG